MLDLRNLQYHNAWEKISELLSLHVESFIFSLIGVNWIQRDEIIFLNNTP